MPGESGTRSSRNAIGAIIAISVGAIAIMAAIVAFALGGLSAAGESDGSVAGSANSAPTSSESSSASKQAQGERIVGHWSNAKSGGGATALLSGVNVEEDGTAHRFENGTQGADYRWEALGDGKTYVFTDYYGLDASETFVTIDEDDQMHWGDRVFSRDSQPEGEPSSSQADDGQTAAAQGIVGKWYYDIDPTGSGGAGRPMYYALEVLDDGTATLTYNGMSHAEYSWTASGDGFDFKKTGSEGGSYADNAHAYTVENNGLEWNEDGSGMLFVRVG